MATWEAGLADEVIAYTRNLISSDGAFRTELERGVRTATGTSAASCHSCHSHSQQSCHLNFAQGENDYVGSILTTTLQPENLAGLLSAIFDSAGSAYANMKKKAPLENDDPEAATVRHMTLRGALLKIIRQEVHRRLIASLARHAEDAELYADPSRMDSRRFTQIPNNCMAELLGGNDYTVLHTFTSPSAVSF
ncbi:MAG: uncharacterized protein KVP18_001276 [Porospora cf. gigantea A]|uniref:uncharacterized protein n=1 Tax=Porospora cf. gigantea A TaxID=2853593 RepID=UPI003559EFBC|nr:MAG: hypothetical protein KVP18_001276 [Porospora cf. gigantea A]